MFTSLKTFGWVSWQEVREKDTGRKAATQVMNFREPSRHAEAPPSLPSSPPTQSGDKICGQNHDRHLRWGRKRWRHSGASLNFLCLIDYNDVTTQAVAIPTSALAATVFFFFFECRRQIRWITMEHFHTHMSYFSRDVVRMRQFFLFCVFAVFSKMLSVWDAPFIFLKEERGNQGIFF